MNKHASTHTIKQALSSTGSSSPILIPTPTSLDSTGTALMEESGETSKTATSTDKQDGLQSTLPTPTPDKEDNQSGLADATTKPKINGKTVGRNKVKEEGKLMSRKNEKRKKKKKAVKEELSSSASSSDSSDDDTSSDDESSEDERQKRNRKKKLARKAAQKKKAAKLKAQKKKAKKSKRDLSSDDSDASTESDSDSESDSSEEDEKKKRKKVKAKAKKKKHSKKYQSSSDDSSSSSSSSSSSESDSSEDEKVKRKRSKKKGKKSKAIDSDSSVETEDEPDQQVVPSRLTAADIKEYQIRRDQLAAAAAAATLNPQTDATDKAEKTVSGKKRKKNGLVFKRVDQVWDMKIRDYKYMESAAEQKDEFDSVFTVRRKFGWDNKYLETKVDIKSKLLRDALQVVFKDCKSISLVEDSPSIQPSMLYHFYREIKTHTRKTLKSKLRSAKKRKDRKQLTQQIAQCKLLLRYIDEDYKETRKTLKPMLKAGTITYNLIWALFKPNTIIYTPTYGNKDDPRCFKVDYCYEEEDWFGNKKWNIEGRYLEYDGKVFGLGDHFVQILFFKGPRRISNVGAYPLSYHKNPEALREQLVERGKKFVSLQGMNYRFQKGLAYRKVKRVVMKFNINGRVMVDPALFRRIESNYPLSYIRADELDNEDEDDDSDSGGGCGCGSGSDSEEEQEEADDEDGDNDPSSKIKKPKGRVVMWKDKNGKRYLIRVSSSTPGPDITSQSLDVVHDPESDASNNHIFTEEELLIASPVVLGFSFSEKAWVEFSLAGLEEIQWNNEAFDTLVLAPQIKQNLKGLVSSHRFDAARTIDDVIVGKGKGLNVVLHGPPGVGKTLTGESIAEYLRCPLYAVSSGELGTSAPQLERDLNRIMDITHAWGAILLLDEADVFLEARQPHDIHRNALVSVFLRLTEYYQGILFLTTNRVATFDEAFQSRIHMGIRYENLGMKARKKIWMHHVGKVIAMSSTPSSSSLSNGDANAGEGDTSSETTTTEDTDTRKCKKFDDADYDELSKKVMNGRQIKNAVKTSQAIAVAEKRAFGMEYVKRVMDAHEAFEEDMKGGHGYRDAMRSYT
ncbi:unnamed protein product [Periconia digitata]|uniref:AAA+ ATPase domain-containing protein n=1 Tax=Periconia digitata TaxID=1303443 RepID=A0A9W4UF31_9PLEO|nr:unnamed protein product [Periconia digitata]